MFSRPLFETQRPCRICTDGATATTVYCVEALARTSTGPSLRAGLHKILVAFCRFLAGIFDFLNSAYPSVSHVYRCPW